MKQVTLLLLTASFSFITQPQTILPNTPSAAITIEADDSIGKPFAVGETMDLSFQSSSPTGKFVTNTGTTAGHVMAKGTVHKTFYYIDPTPGAYTLTVTANGRTSKQTYTASQQITVSNTLPAPTPVVAIPKKTSMSKVVQVKATQATSSDSMSWPTSATQSIASTATSDVATVYEAKPQTPIFDSILDWPSKIWHWLKAVFSRWF